MAQIQSGQDVSDLMNVKSGDDVTSLMSQSSEVPNLTEQPKPEAQSKGLLSTAYEKLMTPLLGEAESGKPSLLSSGIDVGASIPGLNKIWPGGIHIPGAAEIYNEVIRPMSSPIGLGMMGLEGAINRFGSNFGKSSPVEEAPVKSPALPETLSEPKPELPLNNSQMLKPSSESVVPQSQPNRLRPLNSSNEAMPELSNNVTRPVVESPPVVEKPTDTVIPKPGQAKAFSDISPLTANVTSADQTLSSRPITKPIADAIITAQDKKSQWIATTERELSELSKGLNKSDRETLGMLIDGQQIEGAPLELQQRAEKARVVLDQIHEMFPEGATKAGENVGYLENYFTHIQHQPEDLRSSISNILDHHFGVLKGEEINAPKVKGKEGIGDFFETGKGNPSSPFVEERTGNANSLIYDVNKVFPAYIESAARVIFDKPAVQQATRLLRDVPESNLKELATWYIKNYSRYDAEPGLHNAWNRWANSIARTTARSLLGFNTGLQTLHAARVFGNLYPELGTKYTAYGLGQIAKNPIQAWSEAAKLGLLQNEIRPFSFRTPMEKFDSISNFLSMADYVDKAAGYHGFKKKFLDSGMDENTASLNALRETKRVSQAVDPARQMKLMSPDSNIAGGEVMSKLGWQFKQVPAKIVEQYIRIAQQAKDNPKQAARLATGVGLVLGANEGLRTFHLDPAHMIPSGVFGAFGDTVTRVSRALAKGDVLTALKETALWATPGGKSIQRQLTKGPSAFQ